MTKPNAETTADRGLYSGLIRLHVLYHAVGQPRFGFAMVEELARHGYKISQGAPYPLLRGMEKRGYPAATERADARSPRKVYRATPLGRKALEAARQRVRELIGEWFEKD